MNKLIPRLTLLKTYHNGFKDTARSTIAHKPSFSRLLQLLKTLLLKSSSLSLRNLVQVFPTEACSGFTHVQQEANYNYIYRYLDTLHVCITGLNTEVCSTLQVCKTHMSYDRMLKLSTLNELRCCDHKFDSRHTQQQINSPRDI